MIVTTAGMCFYGWSTSVLLMKVLRDKQVHLTISEGRRFRKHARWLLHNNHHGFLARTENVSCSCTSHNELVRWPYDLNCTNDVGRSQLPLALYECWLQVACANPQHFNWTCSRRTLHSFLCVIVIACCELNIEVDIWSNRSAWPASVLR